MTNAGYRICAAMPGCLPDGETYPYDVDDKQAAREAIREEIERAYEQEPVSDEQIEAYVHAAIRELDLHGYSAAPLGIYTLTVEPIIPMGYTNAERQA